RAWSSDVCSSDRQRVAVARALLTRPDVIFADEPTGNLDSHAGAEVLSLLGRATTLYGQTIIMVTHDPMAASHAHRVVLLKDGRATGEVRPPTRDRGHTALSDVSALCSLALWQIRIHWARFLAIGLGIALAAGFVATTLIINSSLQNSLESAVGRSFSRSEERRVGKEGRTR